MDAAIQKSFTPVSQHDVDTMVAKTIVAMREAVGVVHSHGVLVDVQKDYCLALTSSYRVPFLRQLIKIHKIIPESRLIAAGTRWVTNPLAIFFATHTQAAVEANKHVAVDTRDVIKKIEELNSRGVDSDSSVASFDVEQLYPSIDQAKALGTARAELIRFYASRHIVKQWGLFVEFLIDILAIILGAQIVVVRMRNGVRQFYVQTVGISTGLACSTQVANLYLACFDRHICDTLHASIYLYKRFVDDTLVVYRRGLFSTLAAMLNSFDESIRVTHDVSELEHYTTFLDLQITRKDGVFDYSTHRKKLCTYAYLPFNSCHSFSSRIGIVHTEFYRLLLTNREEHNFNSQVAFFYGKLKNRGYKPSLVRKYAERYKWTEKRNILSKTSEKTIRSQVVPFILPYSEAITELGTTGIFKMHEHFLPSSFKSSHRLSSCHTVGRHFFA